MYWQYSKRNIYRFVLILQNDGSMDNSGKIHNMYANKEIHIYSKSKDKYLIVISVDDSIISYPIIKHLVIGMVVSIWANIISRMNKKLG